jgi:phenylacetate-CoA ligase
MYQDVVEHSDPFVRLSRVPVFPKTQLDAHSPEACADLSRADWRLDRTSGTSGRSFQFWLTRPELALRRAYEYRANELLGFPPGARHLVIWGGHESQGWRTRLKNAAYSTLQHRELRIVPATGAAFLAPLLPRLEAHRGGVLVTYPNLLFGLLEAGAIEALRTFTAVLLTGEAVDFRQFDGLGLNNLRNRYGTREFGAVALGQGQVLSYFADRFVVECDPQLGLLITDLAKRAMPMLRYPVGDFVEGFRPEGLGDPVLGLPILGHLQGRVMDRLRGRSGKAFLGTFWTITLKSLGVRQFRLQEIQPAVLQLDFVAPFSGEELLRRLSPILGDEFTIRPQRREDIPELQNAKQKIVVARAD